MTDAAATTPEATPPASEPVAVAVVVPPETKPEVAPDPVVAALAPTPAEVPAPPPAAPVVELTPEQALAAAKLAEAKAEWALNRLRMVGACDDAKKTLLALEYPSALPADPIEAEVDAIAQWCATRNEDVRVSGNTWLEASYFRGFADVLRQRKYRGK